MTESLDTWLERLLNDPGVLPMRIDLIHRKILAVNLGDVKIKEAAFLDERVLDGHESGAWLPLDKVTELPLSQLAPYPDACIFHVGHCGSTLLARFLGELPDNRILREPLILQTLSLTQRELGYPQSRVSRSNYSTFADCVWRLLGRKQASDVISVVKATSITANLARDYLHRVQTGKAVFLYIKPQDYLATMLREPNLRTGARQVGAQWCMDLDAVTKGIYPSLDELSDSEFLGLAWLGAQLGFARTQPQFSDRTLFLEFDSLLADPENTLSSVAAFMCLNASKEQIRKSVNSRWADHYAKDPRFPYNALMRRQELQRATMNHAEEIEMGMSFIKKWWRRLPHLRRLDITFD